MLGNLFLTREKWKALDLVSYQLDPGQFQNMGLNYGCWQEIRGRLYLLLMMIVASYWDEEYWILK